MLLQAQLISNPTEQLILACSRGKICALFNELPFLIVTFEDEIYRIILILLYLAH